MDRDEIMGKLRKMAEGRVLIDPGLIREEMDVSLDLGLTSLTITELLLHVEDEFGIEFNESELITVKTVGDLVGRIQARLA